MTRPYNNGCKQSRIQKNQSDRTMISVHNCFYNTVVILYLKRIATNLTKGLILNMMVCKKHLGKIADSMDEWEGRVAEELMLTKVEIASIKTEYPLKLDMQT